MYGYDLIINGKQATGDIIFQNICCSNRMIDKFRDDKVFIENDKYVAILDGVVLNKKQLQEQYGSKPWTDVIIEMYIRKGETFFSELRGSFSGAIIDKEKGGKVVLFTDHLGTRFTYYVHVGSFFCVTENMGHIYEIMKENGINYDLSIDGAYMLLSYGFMLEDKTLCEQVRKIQPGCYVTFENNVVTEKCYYKLDNTPDMNITENEAIELVDENFRKAVIREFEKDCEYGYQHLVALSGGLDSRMTCFVAHHCGYEKQLNFTFSQTNYWDEKVPKQIAEDLRHEWIFKALDNGLWLLDVDEITRKTGGNVLYYGTAHGNSLYRYLNFNKLGIMHTGQISGAMNGGHVSKPEEWQKQFILSDAAYSRKFINNVSTQSTDLNQELGWYYYRCLNGTNSGSQVVYNYTETLAPFLDLEFLEKVLMIPIHYRVHHHLYKKWITIKYPDAANYVWETLGTKITEPVYNIMGRELTKHQLYGKMQSRIAKILGKNEGRRSTRQHMNPIAFYYSNNEDVRNLFDSYRQYINMIENAQLRKDVEELFNSGTPMERIQAVSLLSAIKLFYC